MYGDAGQGGLPLATVMARFNPARWSGGIGFDECVKQLEEEKKKEGNAGRPVVVKVPAGFASKENELHNIDEAIAFVKGNDPVVKQRELEKQRAAMEAAKKEADAKERLRKEREAATNILTMAQERVTTAQANVEYLKKKTEEDAQLVQQLKAEKEDADKAAAVKHPDCEWMYGDLLWGANIVPTNWSGSISFEKGIEQLENQQKKKDRPIIVKIPSGVTSKENKFKNCENAIQFIKDSNPNTKALTVEEKATALENAVNSTADGKKQLAESESELKAAQDAEAEAKEALAALPDAGGYA